jgi:hypothetical protein
MYSEGDTSPSGKDGTDIFGKSVAFSRKDVVQFTAGRTLSVQETRYVPPVTEGSNGMPTPSA